MREARNLPQGAEAAERPAGVADRVTLQVADADGRSTRIRVSVLGHQVRAVIQPPDAETARQLERRMDELQTSLARQGYAGSTVRVQAPGGAEGGGQSPWTGSGSGSGTGQGHQQESRAMERPAGEERQGSARREPDRDWNGEGRRQTPGRFRERGPRDRRRQ